MCQIWSFFVFELKDSFCVVFTWFSLCCHVLICPCFNGGMADGTDGTDGTDDTDGKDLVSYSDLGTGW